MVSATDEAWRLLASYLDRYPSANGQYHRCVINKLLSHGVPLPDWLVKSYKVRDEPMVNLCDVFTDRCLLFWGVFLLVFYPRCSVSLQTVDAASLLRLFLNFDLLDDAAELVTEYVDALLGKGHVYYGIQVQVPHAAKFKGLYMFLPSFFMRWTQRFKTFSIHTK